MILLVLFLALIWSAIHFRHQIVAHLRKIGLYLRGPARKFLSFFIALENDA